MQTLETLYELLEKSIKEDAPMIITGGGIIQDGYDSQVDETRRIMNHAKEWLANYQKELVDTSWISTLKIKYTNVTGYFIEVPVSQVKNVPDTFTVKQTLVSWARYVTQELRDFEKKLVEGEGILAQREFELFQQIREEILWHYKTIKTTSDEIANVDMLQSLAQSAREGNYTCPEIHNRYELKIEWGRHPIIEKIQRDFVSNDLDMTSKNYVHIVTGPNMWGKSTFLRQNALIILMAHIGSYVPARYAKIPLTDKIFSRVWATDNLFMGQSTFMVEMQEAANILNNSTDKSFVIIDEIGRGTSTYDGMSLAWWILKYNHDSIKAKTLFATHYHELVDESESLENVRNFSVAVGENEENLVFLRKIIPWGMKKSYGIEVARIAWVGKEVISEAKNMLRKLEIEHKKASQIQLQLWEYKEVEVIYKEKISEVEEELKSITLDHMTPLEALMKLSELKKKIQ